MSAAYSADEMMAVEAARRLTSHNVCFVGIGLPSTAANLARRTHAPGCVLVYESGTIGAKPTRLPLSIGDGELAETADTVVSVPEMFAYWLQSGRIDVGFLGAAQIDRHGNLNSTVIGSYEAPKVRLPGGGGAPEIATSVENVFVMLRHTHRAFVERLDFKTSRGDRVRVVVSDLGILEPRDGELTLVRVHPGVRVDDVRAATGWELEVAPDVGETEPPTKRELAVARPRGPARLPGVPLDAAARAEGPARHVARGTARTGGTRVRGRRNRRAGRRPDQAARG
jgi:glutaconate CoA-transferase, subunit B